MTSHQLKTASLSLQKIGVKNVIITMGYAGAYLKI